jgi:hypothetical protein
MAKTTLRKWLDRWSRLFEGRKPSRRTPAANRPTLERLEDRLAPANNITVIVGAAGTGTLDHFLTASNGTINVSDDPGDNAATLSQGALQGVGASINISIAAASSITFNDLGTLSLQTGAGNSASFMANTGAITVSNIANTFQTAGASVTFSAGTNLTVPNLNTGGGDVSLTAGATGTGNLQFENILTNGSGNMTFQAGSTGGTITQSGAFAAVGQAITANAVGAISVNSLRGTTVTLACTSASVTSTGTSPIQGSAQVTLSAATGINVFVLTPSIRATNTTSGNIIITQLPPPNQDLTVSGSGVVNSAAGGIISITNSGGDLIVSGSTVATNNGSIFLSGTALDLVGGTVNSGTAATELHNALAGLAFDIGHKVLGKIGLVQADLDAVTASILRIGTNSVSSINVSAAIHGDASWNNTLTLISNGPITEAAAGSLTLANLLIRGVGPVTLTSVNNVQDLAAMVTNAFTLNNGTNTLTIPNAGVDLVLGITTTNSNVTLIADNIRIFQVITPGTGTVTLEPFTTTLNITVGTASVPGTTFGIANGGLGWITSGVTQVGVGADTGTITITNTINRTPTSTAPSRSQTLDLVTGNTTAGAVTQTATLSVANLAVQSAGTATLTNAGNAVDKLAAAVTGAGNNFEFTDSTGFAVSTAAGVVGISTATGAGETVVLNAGGSVTQSGGANITSTNLLLLGTGGYTLGNSGNDVTTLAANVTNAVSYTDANDLTVGTIFVNAVQTVTVTGSSGTFTLMFGGGTQLLAFNASVAQVQAAMDALAGAGETIVSGSVGNYVVTWNFPGPQPTLSGMGSGGASVSFATTTPGATSGVTSNGNNINITASAVTSGTTLTVSLALNSTSTANITLNADRMSLLASVNAHAGIVTLNVTTTGRAIDLGTNAATNDLGLLQTDLNNVTAGIVRVGDRGSAGSITVTAALTDATTGFTTLSLQTEMGAGISQNAGARLTFANLNAAGFTGVTLNENNVVSTLSGASAAGAFTFVDSTSLTVDNVDNGLGNGFGSGIITDGQALSLTVNVLNDSLTINQTIDTTHFFTSPAPGGANINLSADNMALNNNSPSSTINAGTGGILTLTPFTPANTISVGGADAAGTLGIDDNDLANVTAKAVRIGSTAQTGAITVGGTINTHAGYKTIGLIATGSGGVITQTTGSIAAANLALQADAGIGSGGAIQVVGPISVAFRNVTSNNVQITSTGALTIAAVDQLDGTAGHTVGNFASGGTETLQASSPMTFAINDTSSGTITATTTETGGESVPAGQLPPPDDNLTVNMNVTVESTGGDVDFTSGDSIITLSGSLVKSDTGAVNLSAGMGDNDADAMLDLGGSLSGASINLSSPGDICVSGISSTGPVTITSTGGAILDCADPMGGDGTDITAPSVNLNAAKGIGVNGTGVTEANNAELEIQASTLAFSNSTSGDVHIINVMGDLSASGTNSAPGGAIALTVQNGNMLAVNAGGISSTNNAGGPFTNNITLTADTMILIGTVNAGSAIVTLAPFTSGRPIDLGHNPSVLPGELGLAQLDLNNVTAAVLRIGSSSAGGIAFTAPITNVGTGWNTLSLLTGSTVSEPGAGSIAVTSLAIQAASLIGLGGTNAVSNVAGSSTSSAFVFRDSLSLTVTTVDGVSGISTGAIILVESTVANTSLTVSQPVTTNGHQDITFTFDNMTLSAGVSASGHRVTLQPFSSGQLIDVGGADAVGTLGLDQTDLGHVTAATLQVGNSNSGNITVSNAIALTAAATLDLETGGGVSETIIPNLGTISVANLAIRAVNAVAMNNANDVTTGALAADVTAAGQGFGFTDANGLTIGTADGLMGITTNGGAIVVLANAGNLTVNNNVSAGAATITLTAGGLNHLFSNNAAISTSGGHMITIVGDQMALGASPTSSITAGGGGRVLLQEFTGGLPLNLGTAGDPTGALNLTDTELNTITTIGVLQVGNGGSETLSVTAAINLLNVGTLTLFIGGPIVNTAGSTLAVQSGAGNLRLSAAGGVSLTGNNSVANLSGNVTEPGQGFIFTNAGALGIGTVDGLAGITTNGGGITITASAVTSGTALTVSQPIDTTTTADIMLTADRMTLSAAVNAHAGIVSLFPTTFGRNIDVGTNSNTSDLGLLQTDLNNVTAGILRIRSALSSSGGDSITFTAPITDVGTGWSTLSLIAAPMGTVSQNAGATVTVVNLQAAGLGGVSLNENNIVAKLAGASAGAFSFTDVASSLAIDNVDNGLGLGFGIGIIGGSPIVVSLNNAGGVLTVNQAIDTTHFGGPGGTVVLTADDMAIGATVNAGTRDANLVPFSNTRVVDLGTNSAGNLGLTDAELDMVNASTLRVGSTSDTANMQVTGTIDSETHYSVLSLSTGGAIVQVAGGKLQVPSLGLRAGTGIGSATPVITQVTNLAATNSSSGNIQITNTGALTISVVDAPIGVFNSAPGGTVSITNAGGGGNPLTVNVGVIASGPITLTAGGSLTLQKIVPAGVTPNIQATGGTVTLNFGADNTGSTNVIAGGLSGTTVSAMGGTGDDSLLLDFTGGAALPNGMSYNGGSGVDDTMTLSDVGSNTSHTYNLLAASAARDAATIAFANLASVSVKGGNQIDGFNVTPSATTAFFLDGGPPSTTPGDSVNLNTAGAAVSVGVGNYTVQGTKTVNYTNIETVHLNDAVAISGFYGPDTADRNQLNGLTPTQRFVQVLYLNALGRAGSMAELNGWVAVYNNNGANGQSVVATSIEHSMEARDHIVKDWYQAFLGRAAAGGEEQVWVNMLLNGATEETALGGILASQEFFNRAQTLVGTGTANERYIQALYQLLLGRSGSAAEVSGQAALIASIGRAGVAQGILTSGEYRTNLINTYYEVLLHRVPSAAEVAGWFALNLDQGTQRLDIETGSIEFFNDG